MSRPPKPDRQWPDIRVGELTELQEALTASQMSRDFDEVVKFFKEVGIDFVEAFDDAVKDSPDEEIVVLDEGCGTGAAIEHFWHRMKDQKSLKGRPLRTIGVDENPLPYRMPKHVTDGKIHTEFLKEDVEFLSLPDNSVHFGFSVALMRYCEDPLRVLEEAYRVLKPNGVMIYYLSSLTDVSLLPFTENILRRTPGGDDNFYFVMGPDTNRCALICYKDPESEFHEFPYELRATLPPFCDRHSESEFLSHKIYRRTDEIRKSTRGRALIVALGAVLSLLPGDNEAGQADQSEAAAIVTDSE